jgi:hypothetical protein
MADTTETASTAVKLTFATMTTMVVGSMVGAGVFSLPSRFAQQTGIAGALIALTELVILAVSIVGAVLGVVALVAGWITI